MQFDSQHPWDRVLWALDRGERPARIARRLDISRGWVYQVIRDRVRKKGQWTRFQIGANVAPVSPIWNRWWAPGSKPNPIWP
jgi:hypothetical protein